MRQGCHIIEVSHNQMSYDGGSTLFNKLIL